MLQLQTGWSPLHIRDIHQFNGHSSVKRTLYFVKMVSPGIPKAAAREVIRNCDKCQSIDPGPMHWKMGRLDVRKNWSWVGMDVTHFWGGHDLMQIDFTSSWFAIWKPLLRQDSVNIIRQLETIFYEGGPPVERATAKYFVERYSQNSLMLHIRMRFRCTYVPSGNGIVERFHCTIKRIDARSQCSIIEAVYWYNVTPKDDTTASTALANSIHMYQVPIKGHRCCTTTRTHRS